MNDARTAPILRITHPVPSQIPPLTPEQVECIASLLDQVPSLIESLDATPAESATLQAWATRDIARRYLQATHWTLETATTKLKASLQWRNEFKPSEIPPEEVEPEAVCGKGFVHGFSKDGQPGQPLLYSIHRLDKTKTFDRYLRYCIFLLEKCIRVMPPGVERMTFLIDNGGLGVFNAPPVSFVSKFIGIAEAHYPQRLDTAVMLNPSWFIFGLFRIISPFMDPVTRAKVHFANVGPHDHLNAGTSSSSTNSSDVNVEPGTGGWTNIFQYVDPSQLPAQYGGTHDFQYDHKVFWDLIKKV
ncbi:CRAL-TRIO domain-containing protein [Chytriomyces cf. hyalinus JEL632]|nr:CRAL-TRIO domain-containing protein [Chytriomyces cf. hyalinus JEL632]